MSHENFKVLACEHLGKYKTDVLKIDEDGVFQLRDRDIPKSHILPIRYREKNVLSMYRERFFASEYSNIDFHQFFHHLNSSQALCINLFYPLIAELRHDVFLSYLNLERQDEFHSQFEKDSELENSERRTSFDYYLVASEKRRLFVEVKYTENGFASAKPDKYHRDKFLKTYLPLVTANSRYLTPQCQQESVFLRHYQLLRNLIHISETDIVVLLFPFANSEVLRQSRYAQENLLTPLGRDKLKVVYLEEIIAYFESEFTGSELGNYYRDFRLKYLPPTML